MRKLKHNRRIVTVHGFCQLLVTVCQIVAVNSKHSRIRRHTVGTDAGIAGYDTSDIIFCKIFIFTYQFIADAAVIIGKSVMRGGTNDSVFQGYSAKLNRFKNYIMHE